MPYPAKHSFSTVLALIYTEIPCQQPEQIPKWKKQMDVFVLLMAALSIALYIIESNSGYYGILYWISGIIDVFFLVDYCLRLHFSGQQFKAEFSWKNAKSNYAYRWYGIIDFITVFPPILFHLLHFSIFEEITRIPRFLRIFRGTKLLRVLRTVHLFRESAKLRKHIITFSYKLRRELLFAMLLISATIVIGTLGIHLSEECAKGYTTENTKRITERITERKTGKTTETLKDITEGNDETVSGHISETLYWSVLSIVGAADGDKFRTIPARAWGIIIIFSGIAFMGVVTGSITTFLVDKMSTTMTGKDHFEGKDHVVICGWNPKIPELLQHLSYLGQFKSIVLLHDRGEIDSSIARCTRMDSPSTHSIVHVYWVRGNPRSEECLQKVNILKARSVIILADYAKSNLDEDDIDAKTIMTIQMIREIFNQHNRDQKRKKKSQKTEIEITAELLTKHSIYLAKKSDANHIVYADDIVCQYITLNTHSRNSGHVYEQLIDPQDQNIFLFPLRKCPDTTSSDRVMEHIEDTLTREHVLFFGIQIRDTAFIKALHSDKKLYHTLSAHNLADSAEQFTMQQFSTHVLDYVENHDPNMEPTNNTERSFTILNPVARRTLFLSVLNILIQEKMLNSVDVIGMTNTYPDKLEL